MVHNTAVASRSAQQGNCLYPAADWLSWGWPVQKLQQPPWQASAQTAGEGAEDGDDVGMQTACVVGVQVASHLVSGWSPLKILWCGSQLTGIVCDHV
jgi:hypothetical protein